MRTVTLGLLADLRKVTGASSPGELAQILKVTVRVINGYQRRGVRMGVDVAERAARIAGRSPHVILAKLAAEGARDPEVARVWRKSARTLSRRFPDARPRRRLS
jgi:hypothetical protein